MKEISLPLDLDLRLEREIDRDRRFEARRPERTYWVRRLGRAEAEVNAIAAGVRTPPGMRGFVAVRKLAPGARVRGFFWASPAFEPEMSDEAAGQIWAYVTGGRA